MERPSVSNLGSGTAVAIARHVRKRPSGQVMARPAKEEGRPRQQLGLKFRRPSVGGKDRQNRQAAGVVAIASGTRQASRRGINHRWD